MYCHNCLSKLEDEQDAPRLATPAAPVMERPAVPVERRQSKKESLTRMSVIVCSLILLLLSFAFFALAAHATSIHRVLLMGLGVLLLGACEVVWTARCRKAIIGSYVVAGAGVALVSILIAVIGGAM